MFKGYQCLTVKYWLAPSDCFAIRVFTFVIYELDSRQSRISSWLAKKVLNSYCDIWPFIGIMNVWFPIEWCGIDGVYK